MSIGVAMKLLEQNFEKFPVRGRFFSKIRKKFATFFQVLRLQAAITPQLYSDKTLLTNNPSVGCIVSSFTARRNARIASAVLATAIPSVCPSVRPSVCLSQRRHVARCSLHCQIARCV